MNFEDLDSRFNSWCHSEICRANHRFIPITIQFLKIELKHHSKKNMGETKFYQNFYWELFLEKGFWAFLKLHHF